MAGNPVYRKARTVAWFLRRPRLYRQFLRYAVARAKARLRPDSSSEEARRWCESCAVATGEAVLKLTGTRMGQPVRESFPEAFEYAERAVVSCPVVMGGAGNVDLLYWLAELTEARSVVETGVAYGWSSLAILLSLSRREGSHLVSTDMPYPNLGGESHVGCAVPPDRRDRWQVVSRADRDALPGILRRLGAIDMSHYDSDKSYSGRAWAYDRLWRSTKEGGYLISDDIDNNMAFCHFAERFGEEPTVVAFPAEDGGTKYAGVLRKGGDAG